MVIVILDFILKDYIVYSGKNVELKQSPWRMN